MGGVTQNDWLVSEMYELLIKGVFWKWRNTLEASLKSYESNQLFEFTTLFIL